MKFKEYELPDGRKAVFKYDYNGVGKITLECLDTLMGMIADRPQGEWTHLWDAPDGTYKGRCNRCGFVKFFIDGHDAQFNFCPNCGTPMKGADNENI